MTNEKMLKSISNIVNYLDEEDKKSFDYFVSKQGDLPFIASVPIMLTELVKELKEDIVKDEAKKSGRLSQLSAAKRILKTAVKADKEYLLYAPIKDGKQWISDGYKAVRLISPLNLPSLPKDMMYELNLNDIVKKDYKMEEIVLPEMSKLSAYIKIYKAEHKGKKADKAQYDFGEHYQIVDAQYLLDMMILLPDAKAYSIKDNSLSMIYFECEDGSDGALCAIKPEKNKERTKTEL